MRKTDYLSEKIPKISIIIINFNGKEYLQNTLPDIIALLNENLEIIVVDNGSDDGSIEYIESCNQVRLLQSPHYGEKNYACNYGISHAAGEYILLLDNDILITDKDIIPKLYDFYIKKDNIGALGLAVHDKGYDFSSRYGTYFSYYFIREVKKLSLAAIKSLHGHRIPATGGQIFIKKELWEQVGGYDDHLKFGGDDNDLGIRLTIFGYNNYLYSETHQVHLGLAERKDNRKYQKKFNDTFYAHLYTIVKNYRMHNMLLAVIVYPCFTFLKSIKQSVQRKDIRPFLAFFTGLINFIKNIYPAVKKRKTIQKNRIIKEDIFLKIHPPRL